MAMRRKEFVTKKAGSDDVVELVINGQVFPCRSKVPGMVLVDFLAGMDMDDPKAVGDILIGFFKTSFKSTEIFDRFMAYVRDPDNEVDLPALSAMAGWIAEQYGAGNPTVGSQDSSAGTSETSSGSVDADYSTESIPADLMPTS